ARVPSAFATGGSPATITGTSDSTAYQAGSSALAAGRGASAPDAAGAAGTGGAGGAERSCACTATSAALATIGPTAARSSGGASGRSSRGPFAATAGAALACDESAGACVAARLSGRDSGAAEADLAAPLGASVTSGALT